LDFLPCLNLNNLLILGENSPTFLYKKLEEKRGGEGGGVFGSLIYSHFVSRNVSNSEGDERKNPIYKSNNGGVCMCGQCLKDSSSHCPFPVFVCLW
jgi:hypothetical protein